MKKRISMLIVVCMILVLTACGTEKENQSDQSPAAGKPQAEEAEHELLFLDFVKQVRDIRYVQFFEQLAQLAVMPLVEQRENAIDHKLPPVVRDGRSLIRNAVRRYVCWRN